MAIKHAIPLALPTQHGSERIRALLEVNWIRSPAATVGGRPAAGSPREQMLRMLRCACPLIKSAPQMPSSASSARASSTAAMSTSPMRSKSSSLNVAGRRTSIATEMSCSVNGSSTEVGAYLRAGVRMHAVSTCSYVYVFARVRSFACSYTFVRVRCSYVPRSLFFSRGGGVLCVCVCVCGAW